MATLSSTSNDKLSFALFVALVLHSMLILGVTFEAKDAPIIPSTLEVTLAGYKSEKAPEKADFLAQENQQGSGTLEEAKIQTTDVEAVFHANAIRESQLQEQQASAPRVQSESGLEAVTTYNENTDHSIKKEQTQPTEQALPEGPTQSLLERSLEIASLQAKLDSVRQTYAKLPRVQRLHSASTMKSTDAYYVNSWRRKIEKIGDINYPKEAENCFNNCRLRLLVSINANGTLHEVVILESSGRKVLDDAALRIVRLASPFAPFTAEMRKNIDRLEIIRTWQFKGHKYRSDIN